ncbi:MAG: hypothetical protein KKC75_03620 [Nanoarchaeota archaeon]|nr:hypothetical protein [Nanoarchaeota archaeon]MBU1005113.1 hypothetical protein [Nanoarchaeota archaeon]MBU1946816.1 hypothetical protein [Nanoarchaeota archaeon]
MIRMKKKCENCWIGKSYKKHGVLTPRQYVICYGQCLFNEDGGNWEKE